MADLLDAPGRDGGAPTVVDASHGSERDLARRARREAAAARSPSRTRRGSPGGRTARASCNPLSAVACLARPGRLLPASPCVAGRRRRRARCIRCGRPFCSLCKSRPGEGHEYCSQCLHLFVLGDGLAAETKTRKLYEVERHEPLDAPARRLASSLLPGAGAAPARAGRCAEWLLLTCGSPRSSPAHAGLAGAPRVVSAASTLAPRSAAARPRVPRTFAIDAVARPRRSRSRSASGSPPTSRLPRHGRREVALEGTLKDFALPDILQLIGIQRKTGVLTLDERRGHGHGQVLRGPGGRRGHDSSRSLEDLLGSVLVRTGRITRGAAPGGAARSRRETLQRLGYILVQERATSPRATCSRPSGSRSRQIVYRLFRWRDGQLPLRRRRPPRVRPRTSHPGHRRDDPDGRRSDGRRVADHRAPDQAPEDGLPQDGGRQRRSSASDRGSRPTVDFDLDLLGRRSARSRRAQRATAEEREVLHSSTAEPRSRSWSTARPSASSTSYRILYELLQPRPHRGGRPVRPAAPAPAGRVLERAGRCRGPVARCLGARRGSALVTLRAQPATPWRLAAPGRRTDRLRIYASRDGSSGSSAPCRSSTSTRRHLPAARTGSPTAGTWRRGPASIPGAGPTSTGARPGATGWPAGTRTAKRGPALTLTHRFSAVAAHDARGPGPSARAPPSPAP